MKRADLLLLLGLAVWPISAAAGAEGLDGSKPLVCDLAQAAECDGVAACREVAMAEIDLPAVVQVDFAQSRLASPDDQRTSPIAAVEKLDAVLVVQGNQNGRGWTMVIDRATGHLSATLADAEGAFVLAGACVAK
jgi:hypothetical protein